MTGKDILQIVFYLVVLLFLAKPLGLYMARVYESRPFGLDRVFGPVERLFYRICGVKSEEDEELTKSLLIKSSLVVTNPQKCSEAFRRGKPYNLRRV